MVCQQSIDFMYQNKQSIDFQLKKKTKKAFSKELNTGSLGKMALRQTNRPALYMVRRALIFIYNIPW
jgi:hypothetical protein